MAYNIIILEDDNTATEKYVKAKEKDSKLKDKYNLIICNNTSECHQKLSNKKNVIHGAIMDLRVPLDASSESPSDNLNGINFLKTTISKHNFPAIVVTAQPSCIDDIKDSLPDMVEIMPKEMNVYKDVWNYFEENEGLLNIAPYYQQISEQLQEQITDNFWHLCDNWGDLKYKFSSEKEKENTTKRHIINQLQETWKDDILHYSEFYVLNKKKSDISTGDIIKYDDKTWVVVTPPCSLSNGRSVEYLTLLECTRTEEFTNGIKKIRDKISDKSKKAANKLFTKPEIHEFVLPAWSNDTEPCVIDFRCIRTIPYDAGTKKIINNKDNILASISSKFLPNLMQRYGFYISRLGQPGVNTDSFLQCIRE